MEKEKRFTIAVLTIMGVIGSLAIYGQSIHFVSGPPAWRGHDSIQYADACSRCWNFKVGDSFETIALDKQPTETYAIQMTCIAKSPPGTVEILFSCVEK